MEVFSRIAGIILPVFLMAVVGYAYARVRGDKVTEDMAGVNRINVELLAPLLLFSALASKDFDVVANLPLILAGGLISLGSGLLAWPVARLNVDVELTSPDGQVRINSSTMTINVLARVTQ